MRLREVSLVFMLASCGQVESDPALVPPAPPCAPLPLGSYATTFRRVAGDCGAPRVAYPACNSGGVDYQECGELSGWVCEGAEVVEALDYRTPRLLAEHRSRQ